MGAGASEPASLSTTNVAVPTAEPAAEEPASGGMPLFSLHRARSNVDELYYDDQAVLASLGLTTHPPPLAQGNDEEAGASEPASLSTTTVAVPTEEPAAEEPAS